MPLFRLLVVIAAVLAPSAALHAADPVDLTGLERLEVFPTTIQIDSPRRTMHVAVTGHFAGGKVQDLTRLASFASSNAAVASVDGAVVLPQSNGSAEIVVEVGTLKANIPVTVAKFETPEPVSFQYGALVALSKNGCNQGACHGSPSGKGGFRLSLRAYDPVLDTETLIREAYNRRTNVLEPEESLILKKALMQVAHGGGLRMRKSDPTYALLRDWIAEGLRPDPAEAPKCVKIEVYPSQRVLYFPAREQQLVVLAHFSDGSIRDVTRVVSYSSSDEAVATVDENGLVTSHERGESAILARYLEQMQAIEMMFLKPIAGFAWKPLPQANYIDQEVDAKLQTLEIAPSDVCTDEEFVRRAYLDVIGLLPTREESAAFLADAAADKRAKLIDALLQRPEYADFWGLRWCDLLRVNNKNLSPAGVHKFRHWVIDSIRKNQPYDQFARELLTATGSTYDNPPANYYRAAADVNDCTETTSQLFLGIRIQCAKCHNHPFERWTQDNYYGIGAFFQRVERKKTPTKDELVVWDRREGEITQPRTGQRMQPWLPLIGEAQIEPEADRRETFALWLASKENPFFAAAEVNRTWGYLIGRGIVEPVDDFRDSNPPSNRGLLVALAKDFVAHGYDRQALIRTILNSRTYQASARANEFNANDTLYFSHARTRLLSAEQLLDAICQVTGIDEKYGGLPAGTRASQLPSPDVNHPFLKVFGQPAREMACQCERSSESNLSQALQMINGPLVHGKLSHAENRLRKLAAQGKSNEEIITDLYLAALARHPAVEELAAAVAHVAAQADRGKGLEDVCWAVLNSKEFLFQH